MAGEVVVDALPYVDHEYDEPGVREAALELVEEETRRYRPTKNYLDYLPTSNYEMFETPVMKNEFERLSARLPMDILSMKRYELPQPPAGKTTDVAAWQECVQNSCAQLNHQAIRVANLEMMANYGTNSWKLYNSVLVNLVDKQQKHLQEVKKLIQEVNWSRKQDQTKAGEKLKELESSWVGLVSKNYEIEQACAQLEKELYELQEGPLPKKMRFDT
ncbi:PREDICTED: pre-mRNA-splicing factor SPF27-like [Priapulus caudatus]|uniref:Pre-mRNA-splicing factor SPF27 n=1 Tax=Priapulus caudatus TaxID=37621 RepID=A0ABM1E4G3_PRICU|nr:PREDICTED: pre-mRNA-splicing factor SPF27-like [Priapulus caudatus]